jgi:hypothetical protein
VKSLLLTLALSLSFALAPTVAHADPQISPILYLNRCTGGCTVHGGFDDARAMTSSIPCPGGADCFGGGCQCPVSAAGDYMIEEFEDSAGNIGAAADAEWEMLLHCVREVYSPYNIEVTDVLPAGGLSHNQGIVAGRPISIGYSGVGGIAPGTFCAPRDNVISFTFANIYAGTPQDRTWQICGVVAQETAHAYGLDHAYEFEDGASACSDPMTYRPDCGQKFFRNENAICGEYGPRNCKCGGTQNSHKKILAIFGEGTPITTPPTVSVTFPAPGTTIGPATAVAARAAAQRGIARVELWINGYKWNEVKGAAFGSSGQPESDYALLIPSAVPESILDITVKAFDDIDVETDAPVLTVTKGAPCTSADTCALGQQCSDGRCAWPAPTGELGDTCGFDQFCRSGHCVETTDGKFCSTGCVVNIADSCPMTYVCDGAGNLGYCVPETSTSGCCSVGGGDRRAAALLALLTLGVLVRPRRRRTTRSIRQLPR